MRHDSASSAYGGQVDLTDGARCLVMRTCVTCGTRTPHAYLMVDGRTDRDDRRPNPSLDEATETQLLELEIEQARADGVTVEELFIADKIAVNLTQLDTEVWTVLLTRGPTPRAGGWGFARPGRRSGTRAGTPGS